MAGKKPETVCQSEPSPLAYRDGFDARGNKISIHYFQSKSGRVFDVQVKPRWSNL